MYSRMLDKQLEEWLAEDVGSGDLTSEALLPEGAVTAGIIHAKDTGILCGVEVARQVFRVLDPSLTFEALAKDGDKLEPGTLIAKVTGSARSVLTGERLALNLLQHLSGIATRTKKLADLAKPYGTRVVDTRKTTPGLRLLEKYAVRTGGGHNHRLGLYDAILIKDNHIAVAGGVKEALEGGADVIMLDNMAPEAMKECVRMISHRAVVEASGGIDEHNLEAAAAAGVDVISIGALTHSVKALDISLDVGEIK